MIKITTDFIKQQISGWLTDEVIEKLANRCRVWNAEDFTKEVRESKNWARMYKTKQPMNFAAGGIERGFDYRPLDDQLRLYVLTDVTDTQILDYIFQDE